MAKLDEAPGDGGSVGAARRKRREIAERIQTKLDQLKSKRVATPPPPLLDETASAKLRFWSQAVAALPPIPTDLTLSGLEVSTISALQAALVDMAASINELEPLQKANTVQVHAMDQEAAKSFAASPRARALLRGKQIAADDLAESGGSYTLEDVRLLLNSVSRQSIEKRVREGRLLAVVGPNNKRFYPVAQFHDDGSVVDGLSEVQDALATRNGYAVLNFLVNPDPRLGDRKPIDLLKQGEVAAVVAAAARVGEQGA
jgi:hypothetical protein